MRFDDNSIRRLRKVLAWAEAQQRAQEQSRPDQRLNVVNQPEVHFIQVTSLTPDDGLYPGKVETYDAETAAITLPDSEVWIDMLGATPVLDTSYIARRYGTKGDVSVFRAVQSTGGGSTPLVNIDTFTSLDQWYTCFGFQNSGPVGKIASGEEPIVGDRIIATPLIKGLGRARVISDLGIFVVTYPTAGVKCRLAIYDSPSFTDLTPTNLIVDSGDIDLDNGTPNTAAHVIEFVTDLNAALDPNVLYYLCTIFSGDANNYLEVMGDVGIPNAYSVLGTDGTSALSGAPFGQANLAYFYLYYDMAFGAYPDPMPAMTKQLPIGDVTYPVPSVAFKFSS